jgi:predicted permease
MGWSRFLRRSRWDAERARELDAYLDIETDENIARGMAPDEARFAARRKLGNTTRIREVIYEMNTVTFIDTCWQDLRYGLRTLRRNPMFAIVAIASLALGTGANSAIFQLVDAVRLRSLPVANPQQLAEIRIDPGAGTRSGWFEGWTATLTHPLWEALRANQQAFSGLAVWSALDVDLASGGEARPARGLLVNGEFFETLGVKPLIGRLFTAADDQRGCGAPLAVISYPFWQREYGGDPSVIGRSIRVQGHVADIAGVTPASFFGVEVGSSFDVALPLCADPLLLGEGTGLDRRDKWFLGAMGRLKPGWSVERASAHLAALSGGLFEATLPRNFSARRAKDYLAFTLRAVPSAMGPVGVRQAFETPLWILFGVTGLVLLIACANLANVLLARATAREREVAIRLAIGASRRRIVRQMLSESLLIAAIGSGAGLLLAQWLSHALIGLFSTRDVPVSLDVHMDWRIFAFTTMLAGGACLLFGLTPALRATSTSAGAAMKAGGRGTTDTRERFGIRRGLVVAQVALSLVLIVGAFLFAGSLRNLLTADPGFPQDGLLIVDFDFRRAQLPKDGLKPIQEELERRFASIPGVEAVTRVAVVPLGDGGWDEHILVDAVLQPGSPNFNRVSAGYFATMDVPILKGRNFDARDVPGSPRVAIVNEAFARTYLPGRDPIGQAFQMEVGPGEAQPLIQIVGLTRDTKYRNLREGFQPMVFIAVSQSAGAGERMQVVLRAKTAIAGVSADVARIVSQVNPSISLTFDTMRGRVDRSLSGPRLMAVLSGFFGVLATIIATIGLYGVMAYMVARRKVEIGIRMALGADRATVIRMILREAGTLVVAGLVVGGLLSVAAGRAARALLFGLDAWDPATLALACVTMGAVAALASWIPARRASRLAPTLALRED